MKRCAALFFAFLLAALCCVTAFAYPAARPLPTLTGDQAKDTAAIAISQLGYAESGGTVYGAWWETQVTWEHDYTNEAWCGMFVAWCADKAGAGMGYAYDNTAALANGLLNWLKKNAQWDTTFVTDPRVGDFIFFDDASEGKADHVAIVTAYDPDTRIITFVGGNQGGGRVTQNTCKWAADGKYGSQRVLGYGRPNYRTAAVSFIDRCTRYASYRKLQVEKETVLYSLPATSAESQQSAAVSKVAAGETLMAVGLYQNPGGSCWYQVVWNGRTCYVYAGDVTALAALDTDLSITDVSKPYTVKKGSAFYIGGILRTEFNVIYSVTAQIRRPGAVFFTGSEVVNNRQYSLKYSAVDDALHFTRLENGDYVYALSATIRSYYSEDGRTVRCDELTRELLSGAFRVSDTGKEKPTTYTVKFDPQGGTCALESKVYDYGSTFGALPTPTWENHIFLGWYTHPDNGTRVLPAHLVSSLTLYARWQCDHQWERLSHSEPTCTEAGVSRYRCSLCKENRTDTTKALGHGWSIEKETTLSCETDEAVYYLCDRCGEELVEVVKEAPGHAWEQTGSTEASCVTDKAIFETCAVCAQQRRQVLEPAWGHSWEGLSCTVCRLTMENPFVDVTEDRYYYESVLRALYDGITAGTSADHFSPDRGCTRAQVVTFLWRSAGSPEPDACELPFTDVAETAYYRKAVLWAVEQGITSGLSAEQFAPDRVCTRAQVAAFLHRAKGSPAPAVRETDFADLLPGSFYYDAVLWAVEQGITTGISDVSFAPQAPCTRAQIVTFLLRAN